MRGRGLFSAVPLAAAIALFALAAIVALAAPRLGHAQQPRAPAAAAQLGIALFAPDVPFDSPEARYGFVSRLAQRVAEATGMRVVPRAFARYGDLEAAIRRGEVDFAVLGGPYLAEHVGAYPVLAIATRQGQTSASWALWARAAGSVASLAGKRLAVAATCRRELQFMDNVLLEGEIRVESFFAGRELAPDVTSAVAAVSLGKADAVFAPAGRGRGLQVIFDAGKLPHPALVQVNSGLDGALAGQVRQAALRMAGADGALDGFGASGDEPFRALWARFAPRARRGLFVEPEPARLDLDGVLEISRPEIRQPSLPRFFAPPLP